MVLDTLNVQTTFFKARVRVDSSYFFLNATPVTVGSCDTGNEHVVTVAIDRRSQLTDKHLGQSQVKASSPMRPKVLS